MCSALDAGGFTEARLRAWVRDDLRIAAYLDQRFAAAGAPTDEEVAAYYAAHRDEFDESRHDLRTGGARGSASSLPPNGAPS